MRLALHVGNRAVGLGHVQRDRALGECFEDAGCQTGQTQAPFDETDGEAEAARHVFGGSACLDDRRGSLLFVGRVRSEKRRVGKEWGGRGGAWWVPINYKKKSIIY